MRLFKRMSDLLSANLNDLLERCEDPEKMLKQAVRDMEAALGRLMDGAARAIAHHKLLERQYAQQQRAVASSLQAARDALARGDDDRARCALRQKAEHERLCQSLIDEVARAEALSTRLRAQVTAMRLKLSEARRKLIEITARSRAVEARRAFASRSPADTFGTIESNFARICAQVEQSEAETLALFELLGEPESFDDHEHDVESELSALREEVGRAAR